MSLILNSIYGEIGPGERISLSKLAIDKFEETGRPLRIAIDISIWQFQIQAGQGGSNPAIRTFYYRLLRLLSVSVQPLFVFDGPNKPPFKRNKRSGQHGASIPNMMCKQLLKLFGFPIHTAPGEAEAECAYLQREGIVDAVLSEDVDTLMFGCGTTLRNWSSEGTKGNKSPTHVSLYDAKATKEGKSGLDREGMVLVALMSGGDYITEGIPGCGIKVACEAARAGFGKSLCTIPKEDASGLDAWRKNLAYELQANENKFFRVKHKTLTIPGNFPNKEVLGYYTHPVVSTCARIEKLREEISWDGDVDVPGLRMFVAEAFDWTHKIGARKFIRGLAPVLLVQKLRLRGNRRASGYGDVILTAINEMELVRAICGKRNHFSTDGIPELRVVYHPNDIVGLDLDAEEDDSEDYGRDGLAPTNDEDQIEAYASDDARGSSRSPSRKKVSIYDPTQPDKLWILETIAKVGIPLKVQDYEESLRDPRKFLKAKAASKKAATNGGMPKGAMDKFLKISKPQEVDSGALKPPTKTALSRSRPILPPIYLAPSLERLTTSQSMLATTEKVTTTTTSRPSKARLSSRTSKECLASTYQIAPNPKGNKRAAKEKSQANTNPWSLAQSSPATRDVPAVTKCLDANHKPSRLDPFKNDDYFTPDISSSPPVTVASTYLRKRSQSSQSENALEAQEVDKLPITPHRNHSSLHQEPLTPSSNEKQHGEGSPRKRPTPSKHMLRTHPRLSRSAYSTPEPVTRIIDFFSASRPRSSSPALPPFGDILSPIPGQADQEVTFISSSPEMARLSKVNMSPRRKTPRKTVQLPEVEKDDSKGKEKLREQKKVIMLRESLPGGWKEVSEEQAPKGKRGEGKSWRMSQVEILDMTEQ
jgi:Holliday junction resolvase YEN1